ncbi:MAG TPA: FAD-binding oxidoreductase [Fimbriimonadaceae bacterium]|nr:FAD-binding oxidoreductase [Fimbriimonadaceae bacterium]
MSNNGTTTLEISSDAELRRLVDAVQGDVIAPGDVAYDSARMAWNLTVQQFPALIVVADSVADVQAAIEYASRQNLPVGVQTTGHGLPRNCDGGLLIRIGRLNQVVVDAERRVAYVGGGALWRDVLEVAQKAGLAGLSGSAPHVGVVGYTLGGGFSLLGRKYGLAIDAVHSMQVVLADGSLVRVAADENPDLFWAIRGGGGGFGVVVEIEMALYPNADVFGGAILYPAAMAADVYPKYLAWTRDLPDDVTSSISLMFFPPVPFIPEPLHNQTFVIVTGCVTDLERGEELMRPMREIGGAVMDSFTTFPYAESAAIYRDPVDPIPASGQGVLLHDLTPEALLALIEGLGPMHRSPHLKCEIRHLGGAIGRGDHGDSSVGRRREAKYLLYMLGVPMPPNSLEAMEAQAEQVFALLGEHVMCPGPLNFIGEAKVPTERLHGVFAEEDLARLREIKQARDPQNRFAFAGLGLS